MEPFTLLRSAVVPMLATDIDTDQIVPARFVSSRTVEEFAHALFRYRRDESVDFVLNRPEMQRRQIILAGDNFGCGSSREAAVWALTAGGFRAVVSTGFGDIFRSNALKNGLLPLPVTPDEHRGMRNALAHDPDRELIVDLENRHATWGEGAEAFPVRVDEFYRELLLAGIGELEYLLGKRDAIDAYEARDDIHPTVRRRLRDAEAWPELRS